MSIHHATALFIVFCAVASASPASAQTPDMEAIANEAKQLAGEISSVRSHLDDLEKRLAELLARTVADETTESVGQLRNIALEEPSPNDASVATLPTTGAALAFERRPALRQFSDLSGTAHLSGYVTGVFADFGPDFPGQQTPPGQLLVPATSNSSFAYDWAFILSPIQSEKVGFLIETHFVSSPSGDFKPDIVVTEANARWMPFGPDPLRISLGMFWLPFGLVNDDWYSASNLFALVPTAAQAFPLHYNERGLKVEGQRAMGSRRGLNYALSIGNGVRGFGVNSQSSRDSDNNKSAAGRLGFFPGPSGLEIGLSAMRGTLRDRSDPLASLDDPRRYAGDLEAEGLDFVYKRPNLKLRSYWISSREKLDSAGDIDRKGAVLEGVYTAWEGDGWVQAVEPKLRLDWSKTERLGSTVQNRVLGLGLDLWLHTTGLLRFDYFFQQEDDGPELDNDGLAVRFSTVF